MRAVLAFVIVLCGCGDNVKGNISINVPVLWRAAFGDFVTFSDYNGLTLGDGGDFRIEIAQDPSIPTEGYRIDVVAGSCGDCEPIQVVRARDILGAQYGAAAALERLGFRFRHPVDVYVPRTPSASPSLGTGEVHEPQIRVRGLQLHTLHPIEGYFAFWEPGPANAYDARRIIDWLIKNRGNYLQWVALDNIMDEKQYTAWHAYTRELIDYAHRRGVRVGINFQLFGASNLQLAFDLHDDDRVPLAQSIGERLPLLMNELPFDVYELSFGEFVGAEPQKFIDSTNEVARQLRTLAPAAELHAVVHVGATQRVTYANRDLLYYFLVQYADPSIIPDIHTVMFYNLVDDAGGAYQHDNFDEHRDYLFQRMCSGQRVAYFPETAYWVAFDNSVPMSMPLYTYSRVKDLELLAAKAKEPGCVPLDQHLLFSTGWEWGYWLNDVVALRASYELPESADVLVADAFAPDLGAAAPIVAELVREQKAALIDQRLIGYLVGRDLAIDAGDSSNPPIISQPDRVTFADLVANPALDAIVVPVLEGLELYATTLERVHGQLAELGLPDTRWTRELVDGVEINALRARFAMATYRAALAHVRGESFAAAFDEAKRLLAEARTVVSRRHGDLHDNHRRRLLDRTPNVTFYQYGYLYMADTLCYWQRELDQLGKVFGVSTKIPSTCLL